jgi:hypothetical protein
MAGIPVDIAEHRLNIQKEDRPIMQNLHRYSEPKHKAMGEIVKLLEAGFI